MNDLRFAQMQPGDELIQTKDGSAPCEFRRKVTRTVQRPSTRKERVAVEVDKIVECQEPKTITTIVQTEVEDFETVTEYRTVERPVTKHRERVIWKSRPGQESYTEQVPVQRTRMVKKAVLVVKQIEEIEDVKVIGTKEVEVDGFRVDTIEEIKVYEVDEWEEYELVAHRTKTNPTKGERRALGVLPWNERDSKNGVPPKGGRSMGNEVFLAGDLNQNPWLSHIPVDTRAASITLSNRPVVKGPRTPSSVGHSYSTTTTTTRTVTHRGQEQQHITQSSSPNRTNSATPIRNKALLQIEKCYENIQTQLKHKVNPEKLHHFMEELRNRNSMLDPRGVGNVSKLDLKTVVWEKSIAQNPALQNKPMPEGDLEPGMQDIVNQIYRGCGSKPYLTLWDMAFYVAQEFEFHEINEQTLLVPPRSTAWAYNPLP